MWNISFFAKLKQLGFGGWDGGKPLGDVVVLRDRTVAGDAGEDGGGFDEGLDEDAAAAAAASFDEDMEGM